MLRRLAEGDPAALAELYDAHASLAYGIALRILREPGDAEDVVQEAFLQAWHQAGRYDPSRGTPRAWLSAIVRSRALDRLRRKGARREHPQAQAPPAASLPDHDGILAVRKTLEALGPDHAPRAGARLLRGPHAGGDRRPPGRAAGHHQDTDADGDDPAARSAGTPMRG